MNTSFATDISPMRVTPLGSTLTVGICESQPLVVGGLRSLAENSRGFTLLDPSTHLEEAIRTVLECCPRVMVLDKAFGIPPIMDLLARMRNRTPTAFIIWGSSMTEPEALRFLKAGARGVLRKTAEASTVLTCFESVANGATWLEDTMFQHNVRLRGSIRSGLTAREQQVLELVEQGLRNKEIAGELGIQAGTVKIHMKHIFEKTGVRGRYGLALTGLQQRMPAMMLV
jgi:two-component system, NarL family, nitrate/nitrite response regulator NarL